MAGRTGGESWRLGRGGAEFRIDTPAGMFVAAAGEGELRGSPTTFDRFTVGSGGNSLDPSSDGIFRGEALALPAASLSGERLSTRRVAFETGGLFSFYAALFRAGERDSTEPMARIRTAGLEASLAVDDLPVRFGGRVRLTLGVARVFDEPLRERVVGYAAFSIRP